MRVLFLPLYGPAAPSSRHRVYVYQAYLKEQGIKSRIILPLKAKHPARGFFYYFEKPFYFLSLLFFILQCDIVFVQKLVLSSFFQAWIRFWKKRMIFDFDDAIFVRSPGDPSSRKGLDRSPEAKVIRMLRLARRVFTGNRYLAGFSRKYNRETILFYDSLDLGVYRPGMVKREGPVVLGWVGTRVNLFYLKRIEKVLAGLFWKFGKKILLEIIADRLTVAFDPIIRIRFTPWNLENEIRNLNHFDIGLSPNRSDAWSKGKNSFKALQYAGLGIPAVCSRIGFFTDLFKNGRDVFYADSPEEWRRGLESLIRSRSLRQRTGMNGYRVIREHFSAEANSRKMVREFGKIPARSG